MIKMQLVNVNKSNHKPTFGNASDFPAIQLPEHSLIRASEQKNDWAIFSKHRVDQCVQPNNIVVKTAQNPRIEEAVAKLGEKFNIAFKTII